jgi:DNA-3-methyladenine glycosylase
MSVVLPASFYSRPTLEVLDDIIGKVLVHTARGVRTAGVIIEAEAYVGESDPACHAAPGPTARNRPLYGPPGRAYVYLNYGMHYLVNAVTEPVGAPAAILIRALEPIEGLDVMRRRRLRRRAVPSGSRVAIEDADLCRGPGNLTVALAIDRRQNLADLTGGPLAIEDGGFSPARVVRSRRIGIRVGMERPWRRHWAGKAVSGSPR